MRKKKILSLFDICRMTLGINTDVACALSSYSKMRASFHKFQHTGVNDGPLRVSKIDGDGKEVTIVVEMKTEEFYNKKKNTVFVPDGVKKRVELSEKKDEKDENEDKYNGIKRKN